MGRETRIANKTIWALEDITSHCQTACKRWDKAMSLAERNLDPLMMQLLGRLRDDIAKIERVAKDARNGQYTETKQHDT